jgi:hypothetical protein
VALLYGSLFYAQGFPVSATGEHGYSFQFCRQEETKTKMTLFLLEFVGSFISSKLFSLAVEKLAIETGDAMQIFNDLHYSNF